MDFAFVWKAPPPLLSRLLVSDQCAVPAPPPGVPGCDGSGRNHGGHGCECERDQQCESIAGIHPQLWMLLSSSLLRRRLPPVAPALAQSLLPPSSPFSPPFPSSPSPFNPGSAEFLPEISGRAGGTDAGPTRGEGGGR